VFLRREFQRVNRVFKVDHFSVLNEPRRPWLDPEALKEKFLALSAEVHPDHVPRASAEEKRAANERYTEINTAYARLREPRDRLAHLLELERGARPGVIQDIPADLMNVFFDVGRRLKEADAFLAGNAAVTSPLLKVEAFSRGLELRESLESARREIAGRTAALTEDLRRLDAAWVQAADPNARAPLFNPLEEIYRLLSYFSRWSGQLQERIVRLTL
jgi:curved DNA-binding protein CbpA